jgi:uncharacterized Tic20 family protein
MVFGALGVNTDDFTGPTVYAVSVSAYLLPLIIFEWYRRMQRHVVNDSKLESINMKITLNLYVISICLILIGLVFLIGLFGITLGNWYPSVFAK